MRHFDEIFAIAAERKGGTERLEALLPVPRPPEELAAIPEHRWLASFARHLFAPGLSWSVIEAKWPGFEEAFGGFDPDACAMIADDRFDALLADARIVRHGAKIRAVQENAVFLQELRAEGGIGRVVADWPGTRYHELIALLKTRGARLGGSTGPYALRAMGRDGYILSKDVTARLVAEGVVEKAPGSKAAMAAVQAAFNTWAEQSGRGLSQISRVLAASI
ncbi:DNA-3-methyladenine glycosylase I [Poseidonocella sp. HB161398]|uniref:DNA-3-methyladenine glycosylase I n=1 Tax=Poseidonocella sp. HB161398 TaxID=2320855 RepID=UPI0011083EE2|nr:DNA-3-methyladenine glycosylase I [Poseidonocella sp. HB161398]